jgi:hypothetical protein
MAQLNQAKNTAWPCDSAAEMGKAITNHRHFNICLWLIHWEQEEFDNWNILEGDISVSQTRVKWEL